MTVVDGSRSTDYSTKRMREVLKSLGLEGRSTLVVLEQPNPTVEASARNLPGVSVHPERGLNIYDMLRHQSLLLTRAALDAIQARLGDRRSGSAREVSHESCPSMT